jgi:guanosine-3',5'-bis(diphosphate) 3'-pyrophosphohydrolase
MALSIEDQLLLAATVAARAHQHQKRKDGTPYIAHPIRVAIRCGSITEKTVALLHDVVEDTDVTFEELRELGFSQRVIDLVNNLTKRPGEKYTDFTKRAASDAESARVKMADIADNLSDQSALDPEEAEFLSNRYNRALETLRKAV